MFEARCKGRLSRAVNSVGVLRRSHPVNTPTEVVSFDPSKCKMSAEERAEEARARHEGTKQRQACVDALADLFTSPDSPFTSAQLREFRSVLFYLAPEVRPMLEKIRARYSEKKEREILRGVLLATAVESINQLLG